jgi:hypothetical protein
MARVICISPTISDYDANRIRKMTPGGNISYFAGTGNAKFSGDGGLATSAGLNSPQALVADSAGNVYIAAGNLRVRKVTGGGIISTVVGTTQISVAGTGARRLLSVLRADWPSTAPGTYSSPNRISAT